MGGELSIGTSSSTNGRKHMARNLCNRPGRRACGTSLVQDPTPAQQDLQADPDSGSMSAAAPRLLRASGLAERRKTEWNADKPCG